MVGQKERMSQPESENFRLNVAGVVASNCEIRASMFKIIRCGFVCHPRIPDKLVKVFAQLSNEVFVDPSEDFRRGLTNLKLS